jgi:hypothetical protein
MSIEIHCGGCGHVTRLPSEFAQGRPRCLNCGVALYPSGARPPSPDASPLAAEIVDFTPDELPDADVRNPFASPRTTTATAKSQRFDQPPSRTTYSLTAREVYELLLHTSTMRKAIVFFFWLLVVMSVIQVLAIGLVAYVAYTAAPHEVRSDAWETLMSYSATTIVYVVVAALLRDYAMNLRGFIRSHEPRDLVQSVRSGANYWKWTAIATACLVAVLIIATAFAAFYVSSHASW